MSSVESSLLTRTAVAEARTLLSPLFCWMVATPSKSSNETLPSVFWRSTSPCVPSTSATFLCTSPVASVSCSSTSSESGWLPPPSTMTPVAADRTLALPLFCWIVVTPLAPLNTLSSVFSRGPEVASTSSSEKST